MAVRSRETVIIDFDELQVTYVVRSESGDTIVKREFSQTDEIWLDSIDLQLTGDSLVARFFAGDTGYDVSFNGMGASKVDKR